jgi:2-polyprenyl-6-methoxyphenol hydroxylase-like FAD-dependent oxidoreductase
MSPVAGVGINLAIQDAVAAANLLAEPLREGRVNDADLQRVQERREPPTRRTQGMQVFLQRNVIAGVLGSPEQLEPPLFLRMIARFPFLARFPARIIGLGFRPEHFDAAAIDAKTAG